MSDKNRASLFKTTSKSSDYREKRRKEHYEFSQKNKDDLINQKRAFHFSCSEPSLMEFRAQVVHFKKGKIDKDTLSYIKNALAFDESFVGEFLSNEGALFKLTGALTGRDSDLQLEAAACIVNLTCQNHKTTFNVVKVTGPYLITFLHGSNVYLQNFSAWALGNMAADCINCCNYLKQQGMLSGLVHALKSIDVDVLKSALFALRSYTFHRSADSDELIQMEILPQILRLLKNEEIAMVDVFYILFHLTCRNGEWVTQKEMSEILELILTKLRFYTEEELNVMAVTPIVRVLGCVTGANDALTVEIVNYSGIESILEKLLKCETHEHIRNETVWLLGNILANEDNAIHVRIRDLCSNIIEDVVPILYYWNTAAVFQCLRLLCLISERFPESHEAFSKAGIIERASILSEEDCEKVSNLAKILVHKIS